MPTQWKCARCSTRNVETTLTCSSCRMIRGAYVVPGAYDGGNAAQPPGPGPNAAGARRGSERLRFRGPIAVGAILVALLTGGGASALFGAGGATHIAEVPVATQDPGMTEDSLDVVELRVGDCFDARAPSDDEDSGLATMPCTESHRYEVFWTGSMPAGPFPSTLEFEAFYDAHCEAAFAAYVGEWSAESRLDIFWMVPNEDGWAAGFRSVHCSVYDPINPRLTRSLRGSSPTRGGATAL